MIDWDERREEYELEKKMKSVAYNCIGHYVCGLVMLALILKLIVELCK